MNKTKSSRIPRLDGGVILIVAYILGLLSTAILGLPSRVISWEQCLGLVGMWVVLGGIAAWVMTRRGMPQLGIKAPLWVAGGIIGAFAVLYFQLRVPLPGSNDISRFVPTSDNHLTAQVVTVQGNVLSVPRLTRSQRSQFWLEAVQLNEVEGKNGKPVDVGQKVSGKLYVTLPLLQATGVRPQQAIAITGTLYKPKPASNPGAFDFQAFLAKEGAFAGMNGRQLSLSDESNKPRWQLWQIGERIVRAQAGTLGVPIGSLVSSIVLGKQAVDLPYDIRDQFVQIGLAHALAASGFQISLILGLVLGITRRFSSRIQFGLGVLAIAIFVGLTGLQPSVLRAAFMGLGALVALILQRKTKPTGLLLLAAVILLLFKPLWIWDLGFQLSFLATLGLLVSVDPIVKRLDWMPSAIATLIAVPLAASLWTLPLQLSVFGTVSPYSLLVNILSTPLIAIISIGGIISALAALLLPVVGGALAWLLYYPTMGLIALVQFFCSLPGNSVAVGRLAIFQLVILYGAIGLICVSRSWQKRWWQLGMMAITIAFVPMLFVRANAFQVTVLATSPDPVLVVQDQGRVALVNSGDAEATRYTVVPFLQQQGVNKIDWAIATNVPDPVAVSTLNSRSSDWDQLLKSFRVKTFYTTSSQPTNFPTTQLSVGQLASIGSTQLKLLNLEPMVLQMQIQNQTWLLLGEMKPEQQESLTTLVPPIQVLWWSGGQLTVDLLKAIQPKIAIASSTTINPATLQQLQQTNAQIYWTGRDGAIQWTRERQFETTLEAADKDISL